MGGHKRARLPTERSSVCSGPSDVVASSARKLAAHYRESAPRAVSPQDLWLRFDRPLAEDTDDSAHPLLEPGGQKRI